MKPAEQREGVDRELTLFVRGFVVVAALGAILGVFSLAEVLPGGIAIATVMFVGSILALLAARLFAAYRKGLRRSRGEDGRWTGVHERRSHRFAFFAPPLVISATIAGAFGYLIGGVDLAVLFSLIALIAATVVLRTPPLAPVSESKLVGLGQRLRRGWR